MLSMEVTAVYAAEMDRPNAAASSRRTNGPRVRAHRLTSWLSASSMVSTCAGTPGGTGTPSPSRSNGASLTWARCSRPAMRTRMARPALTSSLSTAWARPASQSPST